MARTGVPQIDGLLEDPTPRALTPQDCLPETVGFLQDLLIGHGFKRLPGPFGIGRNTFGPRTFEALCQFQETHGLAVTGALDAPTLHVLTEPGWPCPFACCGYLARVLDVPFVGMARLVSITSQFEVAGRFAAMNRNRDRAGFSFGLIQWAQGTGRLYQLLRAFEQREPDHFVRIFGDGDPALAAGLIAHSAQERGGTDASGVTTDARFDLAGAPWERRFVEAGHSIPLQRVQVDVAVIDFTRSFVRVQSAAPQVRSERGVAFLLDLANQYGDGAAGAMIATVQRPGASEAELLAAIERESVARVRARFGDGPRMAAALNRRRTFRTTTLLSEKLLTL